MSIIVGTGAVVQDADGRVLLLLRGKDPEMNKWSIPGGKVDPYETSQNAIVREVEEETGLRVQIERLLCIDETIRPEQEQHLLSLIYLVQAVSGEPENREPQKHAQMRWFAANELPPAAEIASFSQQALTLAFKQTESPIQPS
ncbi:DNA mismatch repair protein MutT [Saccharibacillus sp. O23]|uniref:NUDIX domain-containing protein n=1 Tax=Saccharibacillus sp. O23 TaxID=2009338 RepID=UPI000B4E268A|nr:NUDIX domain-containing protein [Saccharibacillus sp. O23]OWR26679.1 DNA mismatch repair protein MutT [Saccharibacillus sp. O23]